MNKISNKTRYNGIDIIKIVGIFFVPLLHFYLNYNFGEIKMLHFHNLIQILIRWLSFSCIGLFIMSSGYLLSRKKVSLDYYKKIFYFLFVYFVILIIRSIIAFDFDDKFFINYLISFFQFPAYYWYVPFYICLYAIIPYLNIIVEKLDEKNYKVFLIVLMLITSIPEFFNSIPPYENLKIVFLPGSFICLWPGVYFFIGAYFRKFNPNFSKRKTLLLLLTALIFIASLNFTYSKGSIAFFTGGGYGNLVSVIVTTCIFNIFYDIKIKNKIISKIFKLSSGVTYETYLSLVISDHFTGKIMRSICGEFVSYKYILIEVPINFFIAFFLGLIIHYSIQLFLKLFDLKKDN